MSSRLHKEIPPRLLCSKTWPNAIKAQVGKRWWALGGIRGYFTLSCCRCEVTTNVCILQNKGGKWNISCQSYLSLLYIYYILSRLDHSSSLPEMLLKCQHKNDVLVHYKYASTKNHVSKCQHNVSHMLELMQHCNAHA